MFYNNVNKNISSTYAILKIYIFKKKKKFKDFIFKKNLFEKLQC